MVIGCKRGSGRLCALSPVCELQAEIIREHTFPYLWKRTCRDNDSGLSARKSGRLSQFAEGDHKGADTGTRHKRGAHRFYRFPQTLRLHAKICRCRQPELIDGAICGWSQTIAKPTKRSSPSSSAGSHRLRSIRSKRFIEDANILSASLTPSTNQRRCISCGGYHLLTGTTPWLQTGRKAGTCRQFFGRFNRSTRNSFE